MRCILVELGALRINVFGWSYSELPRVVGCSEGPESEVATLALSQRHPRESPERNEQRGLSPLLLDQLRPEVHSHPNFAYVLSTYLARFQ